MSPFKKQYYFPCIFFKCRQHLSCGIPCSEMQSIISNNNNIKIHFMEKDLRKSRKCDWDEEGLFIKAKIDKSLFHKYIVNRTKRNRIRNKGMFKKLSSTLHTNTSKKKKKYKEEINFLLKLIQENKQKSSSIYLFQAGYIFSNSKGTAIYINISLLCPSSVLIMVWSCYL